MFKNKQQMAMIFVVTVLFVSSDAQASAPDKNLCWAESLGEHESDSFYKEAERQLEEEAKIKRQLEEDTKTIDWIPAVSGAFVVGETDGIPGNAIRMAALNCLSFWRKKLNEDPGWTGSVKFDMPKQYRGPIRPIVICYTDTSWAVITPEADGQGWSYVLARPEQTTVESKLD